MDELDLEEYLQHSLSKILGEYEITDEDIENMAGEIIEEIRVFVDCEVEARQGR